MKKRIAFTVADNNNLKWAKQLENSLRHFHSKKELPFKIYGEEEIKSYNDPHFFYRATPTIGLDLLEEYETVIKLDADQIITGDLSHIWDKSQDDWQEYDLGCVLNSNPIEMKKVKVIFWDIHPLEYMNAGFVVMRNKQMVDWWLKLCKSRYFPKYQYKEQDFMNLMFWYGPYKNKCFDWSDKWHGLVSKGYWPKIELKDDKLILPKGEVWPQDGDKQIVCIHYAGGKDTAKMNLGVYFKPEVVKYLENLINGKKG